MECTSSRNLPPSTYEERRSSLRSARVLDLSFKQFLKYLQVLKQGEAALRYEIESDEELTRRLSSTNRLPVGSQSKQPSTSDKTGRLCNTSTRRLYSAQCYDGNSLKSRRDDRSSVDDCVAVVRENVSSNQRGSSVKDSDKSKSVSPYLRKNSEDPEDISTSLSGRQNGETTERRNVNRTDLLDVSPNDYFWTTSVQTQDFRRQSSGSSCSVSLPESPRTPKVSHALSDKITGQKTGKLSTGFRLPQITFSSGDDDVFLPPVEKNLVEKKSQKEPRRLSTSYSVFSPKVTIGSARRSQSARQQKRLLVNPDNSNSRNSNQTNKGYSIIKEVDYPCASDCMICDQKSTAGPTRVIYSSTGPLRKPVYLDGFPDGRGKPGWLASRKKEVQGLVYNRQTHSFHPPLPRKWNQ